MTGNSELHDFSEINNGSCSRKAARCLRINKYYGGGIIKTEEEKKQRNKR